METRRNATRLLKLAQAQTQAAKTPSNEAIASEPQKLLTKEEELRNIRIKSLLREQECDIFVKEPKKRSSRKKQAKLVTPEPAKKARNLRPSKTKSKVKYLGKNKEHTSAKKPKKADTGGGRVQVIQIEESSAAGEAKLGRKSRRIRKRPLDKLNILLEGILTEEARINQDKLSRRKLTPTSRMRPRSAQVRANRFDFEDQLENNFTLRELELVFAMIASRMRIRQKRFECSGELRQLDISENLAGQIDAKFEPVCSDHSKAPNKEEIIEEGTQNENLLDCKLEAIFDDVFKEKEKGVSLEKNEKVDKEGESKTNGEDGPSR